MGEQSQENWIAGWNISKTQNSYGGLPVYDGASEFIASLMEFGDVVLATSVSPCCATARMNCLSEETFLW